MGLVVVDTNVALVANGQHSDVSPDCVKECTQRLQKLMEGGKLAIDTEFLILREYLNKTTPRNGIRPGDLFVRWALQNRVNESRVCQVTIVADDDRGFVSFPDDPELRDFDRSDCKFIAVSCAHDDKPPIIQATDSKWLKWAEALKRYGVEVEFLCEKDIHKFAAAKTKQ